MLTVSIMHILIAPNAFKNSLTAGAAANAIRTGLQQSRLSCTCECFPIGDGGDGTGELLIDKLGGSRIATPVNDPLGRPITASYGLAVTTASNDPASTTASQGLASTTAIIEMTAASGLRLLDPSELDPLHASSIGTGELMLAALEKGARQLFLAVGGSATVDGGIGILHALGIRFLDAQNQPLPPEPAQLIHLESIDCSGLHPAMKQARLTIGCDVDNPLLGPNGAAAIFGPQKGATPAVVQQLETGLARLRDITLAATGKDMGSIPHGGAAGGTAAGCWALLGAALVNGADYFLELTGFSNSLKNADLVITGEGSIDAQTLQGKGPYAVARLARLSNIPVIGLAGRIPLENEPTLAPYFNALFAIGNEPSTLPQAIAATEANLIRCGFSIGNLLGLHSTPYKTL